MKASNQLFSIELDLDMVLFKIDLITEELEAKDLPPYDALKEKVKQACDFVRALRKDVEDGKIK